MQDDISMIDENTRNVCNCFATRCQITSKSLENFYIYIYIFYCDSKILNISKINTDYIFHYVTRRKICN